MGRDAPVFWIAVRHPIRSKIMWRPARTMLRCLVAPAALAAVAAVTPDAARADAAAAAKPRVKGEPPLGSALVDESKETPELREVRRFEQDAFGRGRDPLPVRDEAALLP